MRRFFLFTLVFSMTLTLGLGIAFAGKDNKGNGAPSGAHFNLNIIGVKNAKNADMTNSNRHTIFVDLGGKNDTATSYIYLKEGPFQVCDGNGFDPAYDCDGNEFGQKNAAVFQLPANGNWEWDEQEQEWFPTSLSYEVWARALGKPGGEAEMYTCIEVYDEEGNYVQDYCSTENVLFERKVGQSKFKNVTRELTTIYVDVGGGLERYPLFDNDLWEYFWTYDNNGLKLVQLRFYGL